MKSFRFGILGTGNIARQFATGVAVSRRGTVSAVGSRSPEKAQAFAIQFQIAQSYGDYASVLSDPNVDGVYISLPNTMHHEWTLKALAAGKHVLCEKPLAVNSDEAQEMFAAAKKYGRVLIEAFMYRAHPQTQRAIDIIRAGELGEVKLIRTSFCYRTRKIDGNIRFDPQLAGGALMDIGCYCTDFARLITGEEPVDVYAVATKHATGVDESVAGLLRFPSGIAAQFSCGMSTQADNSAMVCGDEGYLVIPIPWKPPAGKGQLTIARSIPPKQDASVSAGNLPPARTESIDDPRDVYGVEADAFIGCALGEIAPFMTESDSLSNIRTIERIRLAAALAK